MSEKNRVKLMLILKRKIAKPKLCSRWLAGADTESSQLGCITEFNYCFFIETD